MKLCVLMAVYNGEKYLREQLDSILAQDFVQEEGNDLSLLIRDDGSTDGSATILSEYGEKYNNIHWYTGENQGVIATFFELMQKAAGGDMIQEEADYYALADQDDYWMPEKLSVAVRHLQEMEKEGSDSTITPLLYCSRVQPADMELNPIVSTIKRPPYRPAFGNAVIENICTGCTAVMNPALLRYCAAMPPDFTVMHDWWLYLTATALGRLYFDETPHMLYRQHEGNVVGEKTGHLAELVMRLKRFKKTRNNISRQLTEWYRIYLKQKRAGELDKEKQQLIKIVLKGKKSFRYRMQMAGDKGIYRQRKMDDLLFRIIFLTGSY